MAEYPTLTVGLRLPRMTLTLSSLGGQTVSQLGLPGAEGRPGRDGRDGADGAPGRDGRDGAQGQQGIPGVPAVWTGAYDPDRLYGANEAVVYQDPVTLIRASYVTTAPCQGVTPGSAPWMTIAMGTRGLDGAPGVPAGWWVSTRPPPMPVTFGQFLQNLGLPATASMAEITDAWRVVGPEVAGYYVWDDPTGLYLDPNFAQDAAPLVGTAVLIPPAMQARLVASMDGAMQLVAPSLAISRPAPSLDGSSLAIPPALSISQSASLGGGAAMGAPSHAIVWFYQVAPALDGAALLPPPALALSQAVGIAATNSLIVPAQTANLAAPVMVGTASMAAPTFSQTGAAIKDDFNRANGAIGSNWTKQPGYTNTIAINTNRAVGSGGFGGAYWSGAGSPAGNVYVQAAVSNSGDSVKLRCDTNTGLTGATFYGFSNNNATAWTQDILRFVNGTGGTVAASAVGAKANYVRLTLTDNGNGTVTLRGYTKANVGDAWTLAVTYTDNSPLADGPVGVGVNASGTGYVDDFEAGNLP